MFSQWTRNFKKSKSNKLVKMDFKKSISRTFIFRKMEGKKFREIDFKSFQNFLVWTFLFIFSDQL